VINPYRRLWEKAQVTGEPTVVDWLSGAGLMVRRKVLEEIGPFDERFFFYMEETDLCKRARAAGWLVVFVPTAVIIHHGGQSEGKVRGGLLTLSGTLSELRYFTKHRRVAELFLLKCLILVEFLLKLLLTKRNDPRRWAYREVLESVLGLRLAQITKEDLCRR
jgi:GT2 family glycosyltransferase